MLRSKGVKIFLKKKVTVILLFTSISILNIGCQSRGVIIPYTKEVVIPKGKYKGNGLAIDHISIVIPEDWSYLFTNDNKLLTSFTNNDLTVRGEVLVYKSDIKGSFSKVFKSYLRAKNNLKFLWISTIKRVDDELWFAKGYYLTKGLGDNNEGYSVYFALYRFGDKVYELIILGRGNGKGFEEKVIRVINSLSFKKSPSKVSYSRFGIRATISDNWFHLSTYSKQVMFVSHISIPVILSISLTKRLDNVKNISLEVKKEINLFRIYLTKIGYKYKFKILEYKLYNNKRAIIFSSVGIREELPLGIRKYYFVNKGYLYSVEVWYNKKDWDDGIGEVVNEVLNSIRFS